MSLYDKIKSSDNPIKAYGDALVQLTAQNRSLCVATLELSPVCNFTCPFCFARQSAQALAAKGEHILRFDGWQRIIDGLSEMQVMSLSFTGGECMLHPDFTRIYRYAYEKGFEISLLSNGSAVTDEIIRLFCACPPQSMYFTVYGASPETYETVCGNALWYERVLANLRKMKEAQLQFALQFTADKENLADMEQIYALAKSLDVPVRQNGLFIAYGECSSETAQAREADPAEFERISKQLYFQEHQTTEQEYLQRPVAAITPVQQPVIEKGIPCTAGRNACYIDYRGVMTPCVIFDAISVDTAGKTIRECWQQLVAACDEVPRLVECTNCLHRTKCKTCIAAHYNDTKQFGKPSPRLCYKLKYPEKAREIEERFAREGHLRSDIDLIKA